MRTLLALVLVLGTAQDDVARDIGRLGSDDVSERDQAARGLERLGPAACDRLEKARDAAADPEVKSRLAHIVRSIRKREEFSRVFGETRRVTLKAKARRADEVAAELGEALGEKIVLEGVEPAKPLDLSLEGATLWEALDSLARAAGSHYEYGNPKVSLRPGRGSLLPVHTAQQFRVSISEVQRLDFRAPGASGGILLFTLQLAYQRNMRPLVHTTREKFQVESVMDAGGKAVLAEQPDWAGSMSTSGIPNGILQSFCAASDAAAPLTITGVTAVPFAYETKEVRLAIEGEEKSAREGELTISVSAFSETGTTMAVSVQGAGPQSSDVASHLGEGDVFVLDAGGRRQRVTWRNANGSPGRYTWNFEGPKIDRPAAIVFPWISKFHWVEIPFRFEGVQVPPP